MLTLPDAIISLLNPFAPMFQARTWSKVQVLLIGAILATRKRTVTSALRVMGLSDDTSFARYHHVLNRAGWSPLRLAHCLLLLLIQHFDHGDGPLVFGSTRPWSGDVVGGSRPRGYIATQCGPAQVTSSRPPACAG